MARRRGRPPKLTEELQAQICECLKAGAHRRFAAAKVGIDENTLSRWYHRGAGEDSGPHREFFLAVNAAEAEFAATGVETLKAAGAKNPGHIKWLLSRRFPAEFGRQDNVERVNPEDKAAQAQSTRQLLMERLEKLFPDARAEEPKQEAAAPVAAGAPSAE